MTWWSSPIPKIRKAKETDTWSDIQSTVTQTQCADTFSYILCVMLVLLLSFLWSELLVIVDVVLRLWCLNVGVVYICVWVCLNSVQCSILGNRVVQHMGVIVMLINEPVPRYIPCTFTWQEWSSYVLCLYFCVRDLSLQICHYYYPAPLYWFILQIISQTSSLPAVPLCVCVCVYVCECVRAK